MFLRQLRNFSLRAGCIAFVSLAFFPPQDAASQQQAFDTVLVCAPDLIDAASEWITYRAKQGRTIALISGQHSREEIVAAIRQVAQGGALKTVVIMGDAPTHKVANEVPSPAANGAIENGSGEKDNVESRNEIPKTTNSIGDKLATHVETEAVPAKVIAKWGAESTFASDHSYADLDGDGSPDLALGRICADSANELRRTLQKTIAYEQNQDFGSWRRRVNLVAGVGGFGLLADKVIESTAKKFITDGIPSGYRTTMTQASWRSPYSPDPRLFRKQTIETMNQGCLAWVYLGHGQERGLDYYRYPGGGLPIFESENVAQIRVREGRPIAVFLSCYTGAFAADEDCLAEQLLAQPQGPVAVISGTSVTMPYAMTVLGNAMLRELFVTRQATLGELLLVAKQELAKPTPERPQDFVDQIAKVVSPDPALLDEERLEHVRLFHLFGDPLLRLRHAETVEIEAPDEAVSGEEIRIQVKSPVAGTAVLELVCRRDRTTFPPPSRPRFEARDAWLRELQETYRRANDTAWITTKLDVSQGEFSTSIRVPDIARGLGHVRIYIRGNDSFALGSSDIYLRRAPEQDTVITPSPGP